MWDKFVDGSPMGWFTINGILKLTEKHTGYSLLPYDISWKRFDRIIPTVLQIHRHIPECLFTTSKVGNSI